MPLPVVVPHHELYEEYSRQVNSIYGDYTDMIEPFGIDESWLDVTGSTNLFGSGKRIADEIRNRIKTELGITVSAGVSFNKTFAKLGSDYKKPDATTVITRETYKRILYPLPVGDMMYIGRHTVPKLKMLGINTIGDLAGSDVNVLVSLSVRRGSPCTTPATDGMKALCPAFLPPEILRQRHDLLRDLKGEEDFRKAVSFLADKAASRMRQAKAKCRVVSVMDKGHLP